MKIILFGPLLFSIASAQAFDAAAHFKKTCSQCHTIGEGDKIGPDLAGLSKRRKAEWVHKFVNYPDGMINGDEEEEGYEKPDATAKAVYALYKPQLMAEQEMSMDQVKAMLKYIDSLKKQPKGKILKLIKK